MSISIGCHVSIRDGYEGAARTAVGIGCGAYQYFGKNPRGLAVKSFDRSDAARAASIVHEHCIPSVIHTPYPVNLATRDNSLRAAIELTILNDLEIAEAVGSIGVVVHFGKLSGNDPLQSYRNIIELLDRVLGKWKGKAQLLIENQASGFGSTLLELTQIRSLTAHPERIEYCFDTCHAFAAGIWDGRNWMTLAEQGRELGYIDHLKVIHLNDSRYPSGSGKDFHAPIGRGHIGDVAFRELLNSEAVRDIPFILETPTAPDFDIRQQMNHVKELAQ